MPSSNMQFRFHLCHPDYGLIGGFSTFRQAAQAGDRWESKTDPPTGYPAWQVEIYDSMAQRGKPQLWRRCPPDSTRCEERGDQYTTQAGKRVAFWKCTRHRGGATLPDTSRSLAIWLRTDEGKEAARVAAMIPGR